MTTWMNYSASHPMPGSTRPYSPESPFNKPIPADWPLVSDSASLVQYLFSQGPAPQPGNITTGGSYCHPVYYASTSDPWFRVIFTESWGSNPLSGPWVQCPVKAIPAPGSDGHMLIVQPDGKTIELWRATAPEEGRLQAGWGSTNTITGEGIGGKATAANWDLLAGVIRPEELAAGVIDHALFATCKNTRAGTYVSPALHTDGKSLATNAVPMGQRFRFAMSWSAIEGLPIPGWRKTILKAASKYGILIGDSGGPGFGLMFQACQSYTAFGLEDPFVTLAKNWGLPSWEGKYVFNLTNNVDWAKALQALSPL